MTTVELARFKVPPVHELLQACPAMVAEFRADRHRFLDAQLIRANDQQWLDVVWWSSSEDFAASREKKANLPGTKAFFAPSPSWSPPKRTRPTTTAPRRRPHAGTGNIGNDCPLTSKNQRGHGRDRR
ncbi:hypothetical protein [Amycolatopsis coloradensis]|uniref:hypothetical protein n=1 Tax=Amycolatopsis coloradensis TaxID=76021 RepID=UPI001FCA02D1|nr:hypothetical protein [Amycolatopsis coloradensis]